LDIKADNKTTTTTTTTSAPLITHMMQTKQKLKVNHWEQVFHILLSSF